MFSSRGCTASRCGRTPRLSSASSRGRSRPPGKGARSSSAAASGWSLRTAAWVPKVHFLTAGTILIISTRTGTPFTASMSRTGICRPNWATTRGNWPTTGLGSMSSPMAMSGRPRSITRIGGLTIMVTGTGMPPAAGPGSLRNPGVGPSTITAAGSGDSDWAGTGFPIMPGVQPGSIGTMAATTMAGARSAGTIIPRSWSTTITTTASTVRTSRGTTGR